MLCLCSDPGKCHKDGGWQQGWGHWLGTGSLHSKQFMPFGEALRVSRCLQLASQPEWRVWCLGGARPPCPNVPSNPNEVSTDSGWQGHSHWLGASNKKGGTDEFLPFAKALAVARSLGLTSSQVRAARVA